MTPPAAPQDPESIIERGIRTIQVISGDGYRASRERARELAERGYNAVGVARQFAAIIANGDRSKLLETIRVPSLVIHGDHDPLVPPADGEDTAARTPRCRAYDRPGHGT